MSSAEPTVPADPTAAGPTWTVVRASADDVPGAARAIARLLEELGAQAPTLGPMEDAARRVVDDPAAGVLLVAKDLTDGTIVGVLGASWSVAIHQGGRYAVIEELWVDPAWRGHAVGRRLVGVLVDELLPRAGVGCVEVGLPRPSFAGLEATAGFYLTCGFSPVGPRMRRVAP